MPDDAELDRFFDEALRAEMRGDWAEAIRVYEAIAGSFPDRQEAEYARNCAARLRARKATKPAQESRVYASGNLLLVGYCADLPKNCAKCNVPTPSRTEIKLYRMRWGAILSLLLAAGLGHPAAAAGKDLLPPIVRLTIGLCDACQRRRLRRKLLGVAVGAALALAIGIVLIGGIPRLEIDTFVSFTILLLIGVGLGLLCSPDVIRAKGMDDRFIWVFGFCPDYRRSFPEHLPPLQEATQGKNASAQG